MTSQEDILLSLIQKNAGNKFASDQTGWIRGTDVCSWFGVTCDASGHVIAISLTGYSLQATLPSDLSGLVDLENLLLVNCDLKGTIPDSVAQMQSLREVDFSLNQLSGALPLFTSPRLNAILLGHNKLSGMIPSIGKYGSGDLITIDLKVCSNSCLIFSRFGFGSGLLSRTNALLIRIINFPVQSLVILGLILH